MPSFAPVETPQAYAASLVEPAARTFARLHALIHRTAEAAEVGPLSEGLKWGEPSYTPTKAGIGSSVRLAGLADGRVAVHFICHTGLVTRFREIYPDVFDYAGNRSILVSPSACIDEAALGHCVAMALTYHRDRKSARIG